MKFVVGRNLILGGRNFPKDMLLGVNYFEKSISLNCTDSLLFLCNMLVKGDVIPKDVSKAKRYLKQHLNENNSSILFFFF